MDYDANDNPDIQVTQAELDALKDETEALHDGDIIEAANKLLEQKTLSAIISISKLATQATAERVRLDASKYIIERILGPLAKIEHATDPLDNPTYRLMVKAGMIKGG